MIRPRQFGSTATGRIVTCIVVGAGQAGLAMSRCLTRAGIDHVLFERGEVANSWKTERWDSLNLLSPNWQTRLSGYQYTGPDPDGFMSNLEFIEYLQGYSRTLDAPLYTGVDVTRVSKTQNGYRVETSSGEWQCRTLVIATGASNIPVVPEAASSLPRKIASLTPMEYKNPAQLQDGGVLIVGASASGLQLATEIQRSGRQVIVSTGEQVRMPRSYRGRDIMWWMDRSGILDDRYDEVEDISRSRQLPSAQLIGGHQPGNLDLNSVQDDGVEVVGRLTFIHGSRVQFSGSLANVCKLADLKMRRLLRYIDAYAQVRYHRAELPEAYAPEDTRISASPRLELDISSGEVKTVIWATGYRPDYSWLQVPTFDARGGLLHDGGIAVSPGMYVLGLPFMRRRKSQFIDGVADDARELTAHMQSFLSTSRAGNKVEIVAAGT